MLQNKVFTIRPLFSGTKTFDVAKLKQVYWNKFTVFYAMVCASSVAIFDYANMDYELTAVQFLMVHLEFMVYLPMSIVVGVTASLIHDKTGRFKFLTYVPSTAVFTVAASLVVWHFALAIVDVQFDRNYNSYLGYLATRIPCYYFIVEFFFYSIYPSVRNLAPTEGTVSKTADLDALPPPILELRNNKTIDLAGISHIKSSGNYIELNYHEDKEEFLLGSLKEVAESHVGKAYGFAPHRAYWVNYNGICKLGYDNGNRFLVMKNGSEIPVSRARVQDTRNALINKRADLFLDSKLGKI